MKRILNFFKPIRWVECILIFLWIYGSFFSPFAKSDGIFTALLIYGVLFIIPVIILEVVRGIKRNNREKAISRAKHCYIEEGNEKSGKYISPRRVLGIILFDLGVLFTFIYVVAANLTTKMFPGIGLTLSLSGLILMLISANDPKTKKEAAERRTEEYALKEERRKQLEYERWMREYSGVYLTGRQIRRLEDRVELPVVDTPVYLGQGEVAVYYSAATREETKNRVISRTSGYSGGTVRIAKGLSIHTGSSSSHPIYGDVSTYYEGELVLTNKRIVFLSDQKGFEIPYGALTTAIAYVDGLSIQSRSHTYTLLLPKADLAVTALETARTGQIPLAKDTNCETNTLDFKNGIKHERRTVSVDITSIDGMEGHEFEYFCASVLRKNGFFDVTVTPGSGDQGVDVLATKDGIKYAVQCKNYASPLSNTPVQEVNAGKTFYNCHVGVVMTNSTFTPGAKALAEATGVLLWDRTVLQEMMNNRN